MYYVISEENFALNVYKNTQFSWNRLDCAKINDRSLSVHHNDINLCISENH